MTDKSAERRWTVGGAEAPGRFGPHRSKNAEDVGCGELAVVDRVVVLPEHAGGDECPTSPLARA